MSHLLEVRDLVTRFYTEEGIVHAVNGLSFTLDEGETMAIVGESGSGKSVSALSILGLVPSPPGRVLRGQAIYKGRELLRMTERELRNIRGREIAMIFQDPMTSLNPVLTIGCQLTEALKSHLQMSERQAYRHAAEMLHLVGIANARERLAGYPHQFSGGQRQRIMIAMALSCNPSVLIADEPTTALDVTVQAQIIELVKSLQKQLGMAIIWITHDLGVVAGLVDKVAVMYAGFIVETGPVRALYKQTSHPYSLGLLQSIPRIGRQDRRRLASIDGLPPDLLKEPAQCPFAPRCQFVIERCWVENPSLQPVGPSHASACWRREDVRVSNVEKV